MVAHYLRTAVSAAFPPRIGHCLCGRCRDQVDDPGSGDLRDGPSLRRCYRGASLGNDRIHGADCRQRSEEHTSELQSLMRISYAVFCLKNKKKKTTYYTHIYHPRKLLSYN